MQFIFAALVILDNQRLLKMIKKDSSTSKIQNTKCMYNVCILIFSVQLILFLYVSFQSSLFNVQESRTKPNDMFIYYALLNRRNGRARVANNVHVHVSHKIAKMDHCYFSKYFFQLTERM